MQAMSEAIVDFRQVQTTINWKAEVKMLGTEKNINQAPTPYATGADFCRIFQEDMNRLHLLSFLLTADHSLAEACFIRSLEDSDKFNRVFKEWAQSWVRRTIIKNAIRISQPRSAASRRLSSGPTAGAIKVPAEIAGIVQLMEFERFVFVMSVLEGYSDQECSLLLDCTRGDVNAARTRALQHIGRSRDGHYKQATIPSDEQLLRGDQGLAVQPGAMSHLAASV